MGVQEMSTAQPFQHIELTDVSLSWPASQGWLLVEGSDTHPGAWVTQIPYTNFLPDCSNFGIS